MLPSGVWQRELLELQGRRGTLLLETLVPLAVALPILGGNVPPFHAAALLTLLVSLAAALGAGLRMRSLVQSGITVRLALTPASPYRLFLEWVATRLAVDCLRLLPLLLAIALRYRPQPGMLGLLALEMLPALLLAQLVGLAAGMLASSVSEVALYSLAALLPALFAAGVFSPDPHWSVLRIAAAVLVPFAELHQSLRILTGATTTGPLPLLLRAGPVSAVGWLGAALLVLRRKAG